jgi:hypothetical protein
MNSRLSPLAPFAALLALSAGLLAPSHAEAQFRPGAYQVGVSIQFGSPVYAPPPPVVVYQPAPPPPPVVVYQPAPPPPVVVYQQPAQPVMVQQAPIYLQAPPQVDLQRSREAAIHLSVGGLFGDNTSNGGATFGLRYRPTPHLATEVSIGAWGGTDVMGRDRVEVPVLAHLLFFVNPEDALQVYFLGGLGVSYAQTGSRFEDAYSSTFVVDDEFWHVGGEVGIGLEWRINPLFALNADVRGFIRHAFTSASGNPEFIEIEDGVATGRTSNLSGGATVNLGMLFYL